MNHQTTTLAECTNGYVGYCECHDHFNVSFNNSLFIFSHEEYEAFMHLLSERAGLEPFLTTHGKEMIVQTPMRNYYLVFSQREIQQLLDMMVEAGLMMETNQILKKNH